MTADAWLYNAHTMSRISGETWRAVACEAGTVTEYSEPAQEIPVTEEMRDRGEKAQSAFRCVPSRVEAEAIYRAMAAVAPVALDEFPDTAKPQREAADIARTAVLEAENAEWRARCHAKTLEIQRDEDDWHAIVDAKDAEIKELRELYMMEVRSSNEWFMKFQDLRKQAVAPPASEPKAFPAAALKPSKGDPRRVGG